MPTIRRQKNLGNSQTYFTSFNDPKLIKLNNIARVFDSAMTRFNKKKNSLSSRFSNAFQYTTKYQETVDKLNDLIKKFTDKYQNKEDDTYILDATQKVNPPTDVSDLTNFLSSTWQNSIFKGDDSSSIFKMYQSLQDFYILDDISLKKEFSPPTTGSNIADDTHSASYLSKSFTNVFKSFFVCKELNGIVDCTILNSFSDDRKYFQQISHEMKFQLKDLMLPFMNESSFKETGIMHDSMFVFKKEDDAEKERVRKLITLLNAMYNVQPKPERHDDGHNMLADLHGKLQFYYGLGSDEIGKVSGGRKFRSTHRRSGARRTRKRHFTSRRRSTTGRRRSIHQTRRRRM